MYEPYETDDEFDFQAEAERLDAEWIADLGPGYFLGTYDDTCDICQTQKYSHTGPNGEVIEVVEPPSPGFFEDKLLIKRYTHCYDDETYKFGDEKHPYFYKHTLCEDCNEGEYGITGTHPTEPQGEMIIQDIHQDAVDKISSWFLKVKYDPSYKYCRKRVDELYHEEY